MRLTKIVCTLGPASSTPEMIHALSQSGMNIARINFSHGTQEGHRKTIHTVKEVNEKHGLSIALMLDTKGPEIRTGDVEQPIALTKGQEVVFSPTPVAGETRPVILVNYPEFAEDTKQAEQLLLDNGTLPFEIISIEGDKVIARALDDGKIGSRRHINLPGAHVSLPSITEKDWSDLALGVEEEMDLVALSFIRTAKEVEEVAAFLRSKGSSMKIMSKIETRESVENIDAIIAASDSIMVARGDLGAELPFQKIPAIQDMIVDKCRRAGKPVLVATQMLESMIEHPMPTRAEVTDIAHAAITRTDATMLSGETAMGQHPLASVRAMHTTLEETESHLPENAEGDACKQDERSALAHAAVSMAPSVRATCIVVLTRSGKTAEAVSRLRPGIPTIACTELPAVQRSLQLCFGIQPFLIAFDNDPEITAERALALVAEAGFAKKGDNVILVTDARITAGSARSVHVRSIPC